MRRLGLVLNVIGSLALVTACSDDSKPPATDRSADKPTIADVGKAKEATVNRELSVGKEGGAQDAFVYDATAVCGKIISTCSASTMWKAYFTPFTDARCKTVFDCVVKLYSGDCLTKLNALFTCLPTIGSSAECDTKCLAQTLALSSSCNCPASCGVKCGT
jgi:hypothetical protein